ncbi:dinitrogenase iron-molybdenum cofactor [Clostridium tepidiprofundi DSM 19306]|uniref:Dinitrogenase iron-molybdenum cofactor n=1 Tax=Clostridium tepidiprofundi DSM 19306 TaxID=1121338 RepID=A0A151B571_9CLOT|nr:NifB/NifX family molybdenum-iron cluster-binding protein [Clostridium tepidiprofundi]KYH34950.1 dinitrogenase iron-molybdenum cofactor [Clostridium tepidiprofundi DSM 19306]
MELLVACATDDGKNFVDRHFGDANYYNIYKISEEGFEYVKKVENTSEEEKVHADPKKAKGISGFLKKEDVKILLSKQFGANINRMKKKFVPVVVNTDMIEEGLTKLIHNLDLIIDEWNKGEERKHIVLRK